MTPPPPTAMPLSLATGNIHISVVSSWLGVTSGHNMRKEDMECTKKIKMASQKMAYSGCILIYFCQKLKDMETQAVIPVIALVFHF